MAEIEWTDAMQCPAASAAPTTSLADTLDALHSRVLARDTPLSELCDAMALARDAMSDEAAETAAPSR